MNVDEDRGFGRGDWPESRLLAWLFVLYAMLAIAFLSVAMPPFQIADEYAHGLRADQISRGMLVSHQLGSEIDGALYRFGHLLSDLPFHSDVKETPAIASAAAALTWVTPDIAENFQNTAQYGPLLYLPQALGILSGKLGGLSPARTLLWARLVNGGFAVLIGFAALRICRRGRALLFTTLLLPMTLSEFASLSQDALIISLSLLAVSLGSRVIDEDRPAHLWEWTTFIAIVVATTMSRPPQLALLALAPAFLRWPLDAQWRQQTAVLAVGLTCVAAWLVTLRHIMPADPDGQSVSAQLNAMLVHPLLLPTVIGNRFRQSSPWLLQTVVGFLGWLDTKFHSLYYDAAYVVMVCAWLAPGNRPPFLKPAATGLVTVLGLITALSAALYASWTPVGSLTVDGLSGRYLLPVLPLLAWATPLYGPRAALRMSWVWIVVVGFPLLTLAELLATITQRYYGSWSTMTACVRILYLN